MPDHTLHGNHDTCPACEMRREVEGTRPIIRAPIACNVCGGMGMIHLTSIEIVRRTCEEARRVYWPEYYRRTGVQPPGATCAS